MMRFLQFMLPTALACALLFGCGQENTPRQGSSPAPLPEPIPPATLPEEPGEEEPLEDTIELLEEAAAPTGPVEEAARPADTGEDSATPNLSGRIAQEEPAASRLPAADPPAAAISREDAQPDAPPPADPSGIETELLNLINSERQRRGLEPLGLEGAMQFAAEIRAQEALDSLSHTRPDGSPYHTAFDEAGFDYAGKWHGENLALIQLDQEDYREADIAAALFAQWRGSPGHNQNMLGENFFQTGIGVYVQRDDQSVSIGAAQLFAGL